MDAKDSEHPRAMNPKDLCARDLKVTKNGCLTFHILWIMYLRAQKIDP